MEYRRLGRTNINVSRIALGCGCFGGIGSAPEFFGRGESEEEAFAIMDAAWDLGITLFDTAGSYGGGRSEAAIGKWLRSRGDGWRERIVITSKVFHAVGGNPGDHGLSRARILREIDGSLSRLGVERVDLYMTHEPDPRTPIEETLAGLDELVRHGKVGAIGACNIEGWRLEEAIRVSAAAGLSRFEWVQNSFSLLDRGAGTDIFPICRRAELGFTPFSPLAGGWLTGKYRRGHTRPAGSRMTLRPEPYRNYENDRTFDALDAFAGLARERGVDMPALAIAWLLAQEDITSLILGPRRPEHLEPVRMALELKLSPAERDEITRLFA